MSATPQGLENFRFADELEAWQKAGGKRYWRLESFGGNLVGGRIECRLTQLLDDDKGSMGVARTHQSPAMAAYLALEAWGKAEEKPYG